MRPLRWQNRGPRPSHTGQLLAAARTLTGLAALG
jgi:hypothetical protein